MILEFLWWMCIRIGIHMEIQISYEILWLDSSKHFIMQDILRCFDKELFLAIFGIRKPQGYRNE